MKNNEINLSFDELALMGEKSRRKRYAEKLFFKLCMSPGETITLRKSQPLPKLDNVAPIDMPTFRELVDYLHRIYEIGGLPADQKKAVEIFITGRNYLLHMDFHIDATDPWVTIHVEQVPQFAPEVIPKIIVDERETKIDDDYCYQRLPELNPDTVLTPITIDEFEQRGINTRSWWKVLAILAAILTAFFLLFGLALVIAFGAEMLIGRWAGGICFILSLIGSLVFAGYLVERSNRRHGLCCPYCGESLAHDSWAYRSYKRGRLPKTFEDSFKKHNCFYTGLCNHCKVQVFDLEV